MKRSDKAARDNRANQLNPTSPAHQPARAKSPQSTSKAAVDNRANQLNPNNPAYRASRGGKGSSRQRP